MVVFLFSPAVVVFSACSAPGKGDGMGSTPFHEGVIEELATAIAVDSPQGDGGGGEEVLQGFDDPIGRPCFSGGSGRSNP
jgi:hypothetical protein